MTVKPEHALRDMEQAIEWFSRQQDFIVWTFPALPDDPETVCCEMWLRGTENDETAEHRIRVAQYLGRDAAGECAWGYSVSDDTTETMVLWRADVDVVRLVNMAAQEQVPLDAEVIGNLALLLTGANPCRPTIWTPPAKPRSPNFFDRLAETPMLWPWV